MNFLKRAPPRPSFESAQAGIQPADPNTATPPPERRDPRMLVSVPLPSQGVFYPGRESSLMLSPLTVGQVRNVHSASRIASPLERERTFASVMQDSIENFSVFDLTADDYKFVMYWVRMNSYQNSPYTIQWQYRAPGEDEVREVSSRVQLSSFDIKQLERNQRNTSEHFDYPRVRDMLDYLAIDNESDRYIAYYAQVVKGRNLQEKVQKLNGMQASTLYDIKDHLLRYSHGISEYVKVYDQNGDDPEKEYQIPLEVGLADFFP